jgi:hypothetical protein
MSREDVVEKWKRLRNAILLADAGGSNVTYSKKDGDKVQEIFIEIELVFNDALPTSFDLDEEAAMKVAKIKREKEEPGEPGTYSGKERMLVDWMSAYNAILRASSGEINVTVHKNDFVNMVVGVTAELLIGFDEPVLPDFTDEEKALIDDSQSKMK